MICCFKIALFIILIVTCSLNTPQTALAAVNQPLTPIVVKVSLGNTNNELKFEPNNLQLTARQTYKLLLANPSPQKHYFTALEFANKSWTQKVDAGNVEVKGTIQELELRPNTNADWVLVPMKPGMYQVRCTIPGHTEAGMTATIVVK
jgi:uncharacterized cupredoxin-like copper-binding protein